MTLHEASWSTNTPPVNAPRIDITICTFNKPSETITNLSTLLPFVQSKKWFGKIIIVDQGANKVNEHASFKKLANDPRFASKIQVIEQKNFGGTGGFTRGIVESVSERDSTHVLLLDDDIFIEPRLLERLCTFYAFSKKDFIFGGHMLDLFRPNRLSAHSEVFDYLSNGGCISMPPLNIDCTTQRSLDELLDHQPCSYNAWWFCCFPVFLIKKHGLPLPFFIRTDDAEYGTRMTEAGEELLHLPGVAVWHTPFNVKSSAWMLYYSLRNDLILCNLRAAYTQRLRKRFDYMFWNAIFSYRYADALAACLALDDYVRGPKHVFGNIVRLHQERIQLLSQYGPHVSVHSSKAYFDKAPVEQFHPLFPQPLRKAICAFWNFLIPSSEPVPRDIEAARIISAEHHSWTWVHGFRVVRVFWPSTNQVYVFTKNTGRAWELLRRYLRVRRIWSCNAHKLRNAYVAATDEYSRFEAWNKIFREQMVDSDAKEHLSSETLLAHQDVAREKESFHPLARAR